MISREEKIKRIKENSFCCPNCFGIHFGTARNKAGVTTTVTCHGIESYSRRLDGGHSDKGQPSCGWSGPYAEYVRPMRSRRLAYDETTAYRLKKLQEV